MDAAIQVRVDRQHAMVEYAGPAPLFPGVIQVDFLVPPTKSGTALVSVSAGQSLFFPDPTVTLEVEN